MVKDHTDIIDGLESKTLLADYYDRVTGTEMEQPYYELVLYTYDEESLLLEEYREGGTEDETVRGFKVGKDAYEKVIKVIIEDGMDRWNDLDDCITIDGEVYVCRFYRNGQVVRVSSDNMPEDGYRAFNDVRQTLASFVDEEKLLYEKRTE